MTIDEPKFLVDSMLQRLGRWLRAAGYDTVFVQDNQSDYDILRRALNEGRLLLSKNDDLLQYRRAEGTVILLEGDSLEDDAEELNARVTISWQYNPLSRCTSCNHPLTQRDNDASHDAAYFCPSCNQVVWEGDYTDRLRSRLHDWQVKFTPAQNRN